MASNTPPATRVTAESPTTVTSPSARLKLHSSTGGGATPTRNSIKNSSSKGWSPLQISKRERDASNSTSPLRPQDTGSSITSTMSTSTAGPPVTGIPAPTGGSTRRTSSSFRHMATNSLVAKSPFKDLKTREGALSNGMSVSSDREVIHERRSTNRALGQTPKTAYGSASTPKNAIGLGIATPSRSSSAGSAVSGQRKVSNERKVSIPSSVDRYEYTDRERKERRRERRERRGSGSKENDEPPRRNAPRKSLAYRAMVENERVTKSPFLSERDREDEEDEENVSTEILGSPSPRQTSGSSSSNRRRASPSAAMSSSRTSMSDSPSVSPQPSRVVSVTIQASPLSNQLIHVPPSPTPTKSAFASSRRLVGPRTPGLESPTRKTVTFQAVPDVKEFEVLSREVSMASIAPEEAEDDDWVDDGELDWVGKVVRDEPDRSVDSEDMTIHGDTSATADFMDSLYEEGLFEADAPQEEQAFGDDSEFEIPMESFTDYVENGDRDGDATPVASTPLFEYNELSMPDSPEHVHTMVPHVPPAKQPDLPHSDDHSMLRTGDAAQPALPGVHAPSPGPHAHQDGALYDPFLTIQTATDVLVEHKERSEDSVPLGRTSHAERVQAARMLATQKLGLGFPGNMPRAAPPTHEESSGSEADSPIVHQKPLESDVFGAVISSPAASKVADRKPSGVPVYEGPSNRMSQFRAIKSTTSTPTRKTLPPPAPVDIPSPVQMVSPRSASGASTGTDMSDAEVGTAERRIALMPMTLPNIVGTSPLMTPAMVSDGEITEDEEAPPPLPEKDRAARVSDIAPKLALSPELETAEAEEPVEQVEEEAPATPRVSSNPPHLDLTPELEDVSQQLSAGDVAEDVDESENDDAATDDEPLTPPPGIRREVRQESPRIPSLDFDGGLGFGSSEDGHEDGSAPSSPSPATPKPITIITGPSPSPGTPSRSGTPMMSTPTRGRSPVHNQSPLGTPTRNTPGRTSAPSPLASAPVRSVEPTFDEIDEGESIIASEFGVDNSGTFNDASTQTRIRQRISREMIRDTVNQRVAAGALARPASMIDAPRPSMIDAPRRRKVSPLRVNPRSPRAGKGGVSTELPRTPTSPTASAALQQLRDSNDSPQSALDRIMNQLGQTERTASSEFSPTKVITPVNALRKGPEPSEEPNIPPSQSTSIMHAPTTKTIAKARKSRRRSASTGDERRMPRLTLGGIGTDTDSILESVRNEIEHIGSQRGYRVRNNNKSEIRVTYTGGLTESTAGSLEVGKAWRPVRRPSDMNEHTKDIQAAREREASEGKASGTIFVKVLGIEALNLPLPSQETSFCITLDNGIDYIRTPYSVLKEGAHVNQEFSLVEHESFEFSLALDIRRDPHVIKLIDERALALKNIENAANAAKAHATKASLAASTATTASARLEPPRTQIPARPQSPLSMSSMGSRSGFGSGWRSIFSSSPRKNRHQRTQSTPTALSQSTSILPSLPRRAAPAPPAPQAPPPPKATLAKYIVETGGNTVAKTHIAFKPIAKQCEAKVLEIRYPMFAMFKAEGATHRQQVAKITIQVLRLPPLPGLSAEELPGSIEDTLRGMRHHAWHLHEYNEGVLTQLGGDCRVPRRRLFRLVGGNLLAINEVSRKEVASIDLRQVTLLTDLNAPATNGDDDYDPYSARPRSFRLKFTDGESINFSADRDEDKLVWMDTFAGLVGRIPSDPLWARMLADMQEEKQEELVSPEKEKTPKGAPRKSGRMSSTHTKLQPKVKT